MTPEALARVLHDKAFPGCGPTVAEVEGEG